MMQVIIFLESSILRLIKQVVFSSDVKFFMHMVEFGPNRVSELNSFPSRLYLFTKQNLLRFCLYFVVITSQFCFSTVYFKIIDIIVLFGKLLFKQNKGQNLITKFHLMYCSACLMFLMDSVMLKIIYPGAVAEIYKLKQNYNLILLNRVLRSNKTG